MAKYYDIIPVKTYATRETAIKAANKLVSDPKLRFMVNRTDEGRYYPVFIGMEAVKVGVHFHFNIVG